MGAFSLWQWLVVLAVVLILFARPGKISGIMGDFGKGLKNFKKGMKDGDASDENSNSENVVYIEDDNDTDTGLETTSVQAKSSKKKASVKKKTVKKAAKKKTAKKKSAKK